MQNNKSFTIQAPCKINLHLKIKEKRSDGFHNIESIFLKLNLCDTLVFTNIIFGDNSAAVKIETDTSLLPDEMKSELQNLPNEKNIVYKAVQLFGKHTGYFFGGSIKLHKAIPCGAGLGGGSSDAASALVALNDLSCAKVPQEELRIMASELGSDVPFFITHNAKGSENECTCAIVSGRGDKIDYIRSPDIHIVIVNPGIASNTAGAYSLLDADRMKNDGVSTSYKNNYFKDELIGMLYSPPSSWKFSNDFAALFLNSPSMDIQYLPILKNLIACKAQFAGISGSGSSCFGVFADDRTALDAVAELKKYYPFVCKA
ncbi:MAG: 4-(cytidine 5'-diphospho)-2-C-methyl-D-erythritol kinase [Spirochaetaceae bacterium]|jgi:4-diphosphocytidyl-2-C-methyl-D-erythritol kinase|nr:4-(cytidine 5'-diphospho)-2-C-methyl-D-erythritol kinase [Spirochaetaceae bacterium]